MQEIQTKIVETRVNEAISNLSRGDARYLKFSFVATQLSTNSYSSDELPALQLKS